MKAEYVASEEEIHEMSRKEEQFYLAQEKLRTEIRIKQGREKPVDFLNKVLMIWNGIADLPRDLFDLEEYSKPNLLLELLNAEQLKELKRDLNVQLEIDIQRLTNKNFVVFHMDITKNFEKSHNIEEHDLKRFCRYWRSLIYLTEMKLSPEKNTQNFTSELITEVETILADKESTEQIEELEKEIESAIEEQVSTEDATYWRSVYYIVKAKKAEREILEQYNLFLKKFAPKIADLQEKQIKAARTTLNLPEEETCSQDDCESPPLYESDEELREMSINEHDYIIQLTDKRKYCLARELNRRQRRKEEAERIVEEIDESDEVEQFLKKKKKPLIDLIPDNNSFFGNSMDILIGTGINANKAIKASMYNLDDEVADVDIIKQMRQIHRQKLGEGEEVFDDEVEIETSGTVNANYRPRKPRYFNRVQTGYEWTKYNQLHYDFDNPPPKVIQGYRFNIFYPDLIDKRISPHYVVERAAEPNMLILRFKAGPPYEDVAFKIPNREWDMTEKQHFKNCFERGVLYLYFNFKRFRYKL